MAIVRVAVLTDDRLSHHHVNIDTQYCRSLPIFMRMDSIHRICHSGIIRCTYNTNPNRRRSPPRQRVYLNTTTFETFDCLAAADVVVGSRSSFSDVAGAVSTNVKVLTRFHQIEQDSVTLLSKDIDASGAVSSDEQLQMDIAIADWWKCSGEARRSAGEDADGLTARTFYQTVNEGLASP